MYDEYGVDVGSEMESEKKQITILFFITLKLLYCDGT